LAPVSLVEPRQRDKMETGMATARNFARALLFLNEPKL
jgi:hypothetical protein